MAEYPKLSHAWLMLILCFLIILWTTATFASTPNRCYTCERPDELNAQVSCWTDRETRVVNCSSDEYKCINLLINGIGDFVSLRRECQPPEAVLNPCLFVDKFSLQVAGLQMYTVNGEPEKCVCLDLCDATSHQLLFATTFQNHDVPEEAPVEAVAKSAPPTIVYVEKEVQNCSAQNTNLYGPSNDLADLADDSDSAASSSRFGSYLKGLVVGGLLLYLLIG